MPALLHLDSSADPHTSTSRTLTAAFADAWRARGEEHVVVRRDLHADPPPHLPSSALHWAKELRTELEVADPAAEARQAGLVEELAAADVVVLGAPMYNWTVPSTLKAWLDHVHVLGTTVPFGGVGAQLFAGTPVVVVSSRGAAYGPGTPGEGTDHVAPLLRQLLGTALGMDVTIVEVELTLAQRVPAMAGLREQSAAGLAAARVRLVELANTLG